MVAAASSALPGLLASGKVPCVGQFTVGEPATGVWLAGAESSWCASRIRYPGLNDDGTGIIATKETIKSNPDLVRRFVAATIKGLKSAIADPAEAGAIMHKLRPEVSTDVARGRNRVGR